MTAPTVDTPRDDERITRLRDFVERFGNDPSFSVSITDVALLLSALRAARADADALAEWKQSILGLLQTFPEFQAAKWGGNKTGWGFVFEFVKWLNRDRLAARREVEADALDAKRWRWFRQFLSVEDDAAEGGQYLFMWDDRIPEATFLPGFEHTVEELVDARAALAATPEEKR